MSKLIDDNSLIKSLKTEKLNCPDLTETQKRQLSKAIQERAVRQPLESIKIQKDSKRYFLIASLVVLGLGAIPFITNQPQKVQPSPEVASEQPASNSQALAFQSMVEKWDPDVWGGVASQFLTAKANPIGPFNNELKAFHSLSTDLISSFYAEFKPIDPLEQN